MVDSQVYIASVRLHNFLSFFEGEVEFAPGLTVILGPNGSGKTTIFHALKFALGSNQRENRYSKWSDFIRHGANAAEVEVCVSINGQNRRFLRKISRDGIPRAYVDGKRVKAAELRAITDAFSLEVDNTLVFMPQERINALRNMNPIEVRRLVEEGTGLHLLRDRIGIEEVRVSDSRRRLQETTSESRIVEKEIDLLQHDIKRLLRKRDLQAQQKELKDELDWARLEDLENQVNAVKRDIDENESGLGEVLEEQGTLEERRTTDEEKISEIDKKLESSRMEIGRIDANIDEEERRLSQLEDDEKQTVLEKRELEAVLKKERDKFQHDKTQLERLSESKEKFMEQQRTAQSDIESLEEEALEIEQKLNEFAEWNTQRAEARGVYRNLQTELQGKDLLSRSLKERLQVEEAELHAIETKWGSMWDTLEETDERELVTRKSQIEREIASLNETRYRESSRVSQLQKEIDEIRGSLSEGSKRIPPQVKELREALKEHELKDVLGPVIDYVSGSTELSAAIEAVLPRGMAFAFICRNESDYQLLLRLRNKIESPSTIILLSEDSTHKSLPSLPAGKGVEGWLWDIVGLDSDTRQIIGQAVGEFILVKDNRTAERLALRNQYKTVSLKGHVMIPESNRILGHPLDEPRGIISTAPVEEKLSTLETQLSKASKDITDIMTKLESLSKERESISDVLGQVTRWSGTWERRKKLTESIPEIEERIAAVDDEMKQLDKDLTEAEERLKGLDQTQPPERTRLAAQQTAIRGKLRRLGQDLSKAESGLFTIEKDQIVGRIELEKVQESIDVYASRLTELNEEMSQSKDTASQILRRIEELKESKSKMEEGYNNYRDEIASIRTSLREVSERLVEINLAVRNKRLFVMQARRQLGNLEHELNALSESLKISEKPASVRSLEQVREELLRVQTLLDDYRDVDESIATTEDKLKQRLSQLSEKIAELDIELDEASRTLDGIRKQYQDGMNETLGRVESEVNTILSTVEFAGQVRFNLTTIDNEYGVEFKTRIRGDEFSNLSAGSGGERSLVAIGLILSLQRFNPAPVYALDEIDTFLDATNTEMVSRLLHDSSRRSQFILFTPAKSTHLLKHADKRIGVVSPGGVEPSVIIESPKFGDEEEDKIGRN